MGRVRGSPGASCRTTHTHKNVSAGKGQGLPFIHATHAAAALLAEPAVALRELVQHVPEVLAGHGGPGLLDKDELGVGRLGAEEGEMA